MQKVLMIIPAYNEEKSILDVVKEIKKVKCDDVLIDYIIINDGSRDKTREICIQNDLNFIDFPYLFLESNEE